MRLRFDSDAASEALTDAAAEALHRRGLAAPARLLIEAHRPYLPLVEDLATFCAPLLGVVLGSTWSAASGALSRRGVDRLLERLAAPKSQADRECPSSEG
jgi:hypothetical protein